jgi:ribonucleoside-diphosphate reductase alpha chain
MRYASALEYFEGEQLSADVFRNKYAQPNEDTPDQMHLFRIAPELARIEARKFKQPLGEAQIYDLIKDFGPIIPQGSSMAGIGNQNFVSLSNCYVVETPQDSYGGIHWSDEQLTQISKRRGGVGMDLSLLRPATAPTSNAARTSSGVVAFCERYSHSIREVGQNGRRGALMLTLSVHHPDILEFVRMKLDETKVTGANVSVRLSDDFMAAVAAGTDYELRWPVDSPNPSIRRMVSAKEIWGEIIRCAWLRAEPGLLFWDMILRESPADCYTEHGFETVSTNPCCFWTGEPVQIVTSVGSKKIKDVTASDRVWSPILQKWCSTSGYFIVGVANVYRVSFANGKSLCITHNHKLGKHLSPGIVKLTELFNLKVGDHIAVDTWQQDYTAITAIDLICADEVGCIEVENHQAFSANGIVSGNSELPLCELDSCRLLAINLFNFVVDPFLPQAKFDWKAFYECAQVAQRLMDDIVDLELECIDRILGKLDQDPEPLELRSREIYLWTEIRKKCEQGRRTGTGITALGDTIAAIGLRYGSDESIEFAGKVSQVLKFGCYRSSVDMAREIGHFHIFDATLEKDNPFLNRIAEETVDLDGELVSGKELWDDMQRWGRRNIALLTVAPTGSVSLMAGPRPYFGTTSGIEPLFTDEPYIRRKKIMGADAPRVDFVDKVGDRWVEFQVFHAKLRQWMDVTGETDWKKSPYHGCTADKLDWRQRVRLQAAIQKHCDHSLSSTINLPNDVSVEKVAEIYEEAHRSGCKGMTVYRDGCRSGVLVKQEPASTKRHSQKRPDELPCEVSNHKVKGEPFVVAVGLLNKEPYEIFAFVKDGHGAKSGPGLLRKVKRGKYELEANGEVLGISSLLTDEQAALTRMVSMGLRHGTPVDFVVHQLEKTHGSLDSFAKVLARSLKKFIKDGTKLTGATCEKCGSEDLQRMDGCVLCKGCGDSRCG